VKPELTGLNCVNGHCELLANLKGDRGHLSLTVRFRLVGCCIFCRLISIISSIQAWSGEYSLFSEQWPSRGSSWKLKRYDFLDEFKSRWKTINHYVQQVKIGTPGLKRTGSLLVLFASLEDQELGKRRRLAVLHIARGLVGTWSRQPAVLEVAVGAGGGQR
jgi:hypothetical protein